MVEVDFFSKNSKDICLPCDVASGCLAILEALQEIKLPVIGESHPKEFENVVQALAVVASALRSVELNTSRISEW